MRPNDSTRILLALTVVCLLTTTLASSAAAVPAFARKYGFSCSTCHAPFPRLKAYGEEFAGNGFQLPPDQEPVRATRDVGDEWLVLQRDLPLAVRIDAWLTAGTGDGGFFDLEAPWGLKLLSGGTVARDVGYYFYFYMSERGEVAGIEDAYLHFNDVADVPLDVMLGQFQLSDPMMKRELRLTYEDYQIYRVRPGHSMSNLTYDRGLMITHDTPFGLGLVGQVVNGNGKGEADGDPPRYDGDRDKGYGLHASFDVGPVHLAGYAYATREILHAPSRADDGVLWEGSNEVRMYGPDVAVTLGDKLTLVGQYLLRTDSRPAEGSKDLDTQGAVGELTFLPRGEDGRLAWTLLYNWIDSDDDTLDYDVMTVSASYLYARNLRMVAEASLDLDREKPRYAIGVTAGF